MNKYIVTYKTLALSNSEVEVDSKKADEIREEISQREKRREPAVFGRDWQWSEVVRDTVIEADHYSVSNEGSAHFYRVTDPQLDRKELITTIAKPVTIALQPPDGKGWFKDGGFPPGTFTSASKIREEEDARLASFLTTTIKEQKKVTRWLEEVVRQLTSEPAVSENTATGGTGEDD